MAESSRLPERQPRAVPTARQPAKPAGAGPVATGPFALIQAVGRHLSGEFGVQSLQTGEHQLFQTAGRHVHDHTQWLTDESENQNY
ncbi:hypothetical protein [Streptomyces sp. MAR25Y5]|uniref:hypothetical protein n=1 Tax=Streptomyces sp. MAR25Y5 TaxID=2962028 RepID=UPI0020B7B362|nr:hypothetical protein [Streptomyces sp. MAR25Y5]MCP3769263.1 hypothetical protein [Streptomyces sp. MAR25Y5]